MISEWRSSWLSVDIVSHYFPMRNLANNCICLFFQQTENFASEH